nr:TlpA disulfide reductase family protein [Pedobacter sp. ASV19]
MVTKKTGLLATAFILLAFAGFAQQKEIKIGDKIPDLVIDHIIGQSSNKIELKDLYKDGLLIIDFWATWCVPCVHEMKFLDSLRSKNLTKFKVLMVGYEDQAVIQKFLDKNTDIKTSSLTMATNDTLLSKLFPHKGIPHNIWIDRNGIVKAITSGSQITSENVLGFEDLNVMKGLRTKKDILNFDVFKEFHLGDTSYTYRSIITPHIDGLGGGVVGGDYPMSRTYFTYNALIVNMYWDAYSNVAAEMRDNMIEVHTNDSLKLFSPSGKLKHLLTGSKYKDYDSWIDSNTFCYALTLPSKVPNAVFRDYMFNDLERQFNIKAKIENRKIRCSVVTKTKETTLNPSLKEGDHIRPEIRFIRGYKLAIKNAKIDDVVDWWFKTNKSSQVQDPFVIDVQGRENVYFDAELDFSPEANDDNPGITDEMFWQQLNKLGFRCRKEVRSYPILVLYDQNK